MITSTHKKIITRVAIVLCTGMVMCGVLFMRTAQVKAAQFYGGMRTSVMSCPCSGNQLIYISNYATNSTLALVYDGSGRLFSNNNIMGTYLLGSYSPGGICKVGEEPYCDVINSDGKFDSSPGTGTS